MNYYFFLDFPDNDYDSSLDIFNMPSNKKLCKDSLRDCFVNVFYSDGKKWIFHQHTRLNKNESTLFIGINTLNDLHKLNSHKGKKYIFWTFQK